MIPERKPLYRKVNTKAHGVHHDTGGDFRHERNTKQSKESDATKGRMGRRSDRGLDYTPLFKFLLSNVGRNWDEVYSEAVARLDNKEPIFWLVAVQEKDKQPFVRIGEGSYYSGLFIDDQNTLQVVDPTVTVERMEPTCRCCTHTFNGIPFTRKYSNNGQEK